MKKNTPNLEDQNSFEKVLKTIDIVKANQKALVILIPVFLMYFIPFYMVWQDSVSIKEMLKPDSWMSTLKWGLIFFAGIIAHELVHGITWALFAEKGFQSIRFGVMWKMITPYCHCKEPLQIKYYLIGAITPFVIVGLLPAIYAIVVGSIGWLLLGIFFTIGAIGDFMIINLLRTEKKTDYALDHPSEAGCFVYREIVKKHM